MNSSSDIAVRVETVELDGAGRRQIATRHRPTALLSERRDEIQAAIREAVDVVRAPLADESATGGWQVSSVEATFGITLSAEAGVILARGSAEASFEVTLTIERT